MRSLLEFGTGFLIGGLALSAAWGLFWLGVGLIGLRRGTCGLRVVLNGLVVGLVPMAFIAGLLWWQGTSDVASSFGVGLAGMPLVLAALALRPAPDGRRAGTHMLGGVRQLMDDLLGTHHGCGGCDHEHDHAGCG
jgi:hypothetical protein